VEIDREGRDSAMKKLPAKRLSDHAWGSMPAKRVPAWAFSMLMHVVLILALALWLDRTPSGQGTEPDRPVGIAVAHRMADHTQYEPIEPQQAESPAEADAANEAAAMAAAASAPPSAAQPLDVDGLLAAVTETPMPDSGGSGSGSALDSGSGSGAGPLRDGQGGAPAASTTFFGVSGSGRRFAYVFDRSDSMNGFDARPLRAAKQEVLRSLNLLGPNQSFQIIFYNNRPSYFEAAGFLMLPADDAMKRRAANFVRNMDAFGGTEHYDALRMALKLQPDVIFFLTDARIPQLRRVQLDAIRSRCAESNTTIHAIEFGTDVRAPTDSFLETLASENGGEYRYLNVQEL
jgi:hypothetical protein